MANQERIFGVEVEMSGRKMTCEMEADSIEQLTERAADRFGIRLNEIHNLQIESANIKITIIPKGRGE